MHVELTLDTSRISIEFEGTISLRICELSAPVQALTAATRVTRADDVLPPEQPSRTQAHQEALIESAPVPAPAPAPAPVPVGTALFEQLVHLRRSLALSASVPPYVVFTDKTLREMADKRPHTLAELSCVSGVGKAKLDRYGELFLSAIRGAAA